MEHPATVPASPPPPPRRALARLLVLLAPVVFACAAAGLYLRVEPFASWFFVFAWWSYILFLDGWNHLRSGHSLLLSRPRGFLCLLPWSTAFWLFFELCNLRLENWYYVGLPASAASRYVGIFVSFATVLPGTFETAELLRSFGVGEGRTCSAHTFRVTDARRRALTALGWLFLALPLVFPRYAFPLIWGATALLLEPWLAKRNETSLWSHLANGRPGTLLRLLAAGAICGLCWESWNFWANAKWIYTVPFFEELKLFEMPLLGFLGFPAFALECYTFSRALVAAGLCPEWEPGLARRVVPRRRQLTWTAVAVLACLPAVWIVDRVIVRSTAVQLEELRGLAPADTDALRAAGIRDGHALGLALENWDRGELLTAETLATVAQELELAHTARMGARGVAWLTSIGVDGIDELELQTPHRLVGQLLMEGEGPAPEPTPAEVRYWVRAAGRRGDTPSW